MPLHRVVAEAKSFRDGCIAEAVGDQSQHFALTRARAVAVPAR